MILISLTMMSCQVVNSGLFCAEPVSSRIELTIPKNKIESLEQQDYMFVKDTGPKTIVETIYGGKPMPEKMVGCKLSTDNGKEYYYEFPCKELKKDIKSK